MQILESEMSLLATICGMSKGMRREYFFRRDTGAVG